MEDCISKTPDGFIGLKVCDLVDDNEDWNWDILNGWMSQEVRDKIIACLTRELKIDIFLLQVQLMENSRSRSFSNKIDGRRLKAYLEA